MQSENKSLNIAPGVVSTEPGVMTAMNEATAVIHDLKTSGFKSLVACLSVEQLDNWVEPEGVAFVVDRDFGLELAA